MLKKNGINVADTLQFLKYMLRFYDPNAVLNELDLISKWYLEMADGAESGKAETFLDFDPWWEGWRIRF